MLKKYYRDAISKTVKNYAGQMIHFLQEIKCNGGKGDGTYKLNETYQLMVMCGHYLYIDWKKHTFKKVMRQLGKFNH